MGEVPRTLNADRGSQERSNELRLQKQGKQRQGEKARLTGHKVAKADGGDGGEGVVEALDVVPLLGHHEHQGRDHQVDEDTPHNEDGCARDLCLPLMG